MSPLPWLPSFAAALAGRYAIEGTLGQGGTATVLRARDLRHERALALKVLPPELAREVDRERFRREIRIAAGLTHPNILPLFDSGEDAGCLWYAMPRVEGESLRTLLHREGAQPIGRALRIAAQVARALEYAHARGVVHRDIKPENILVEGERAVLADFGVASVRAGGERLRLTGGGTAIGTPLYMSPEQATGREAVPASDCYALGCVLHELLTGAPPFMSVDESVVGVLVQHVSQPVPRVREKRPEVPAALDDLVASMLAKGLDDRPCDAGLLAAHLERLLSGGAATLAVDEETTHRASRASRALRTPPPRHAGGVVPGDARTASHGARVSGARVLPLLALAALAGLAALGGWIARQRSDPPPPARAPSVAVLPFETRGDSVLGDGLAEELISALTRVHGLRVAARTSSFYFRDLEVPLDSLGGLLGVGAVVRGTVVRDGERLRVTARLEDVATRSQLWEEQYEGPYSDVFQIQDDIARAIATRLGAALHLRSRRALVTDATRDMDAYSLYLEGRSALGERSLGGLRRAIELFGLATRRDPQFAHAWSGLADAHIMIGSPEYAGMLPDQAYARAREAALRAIALDSTIAEAHASIAHVHEGYDFDWEKADRAYRTALALNPTYVAGLAWHAQFLMKMGRADEALEAAEQAVALDPLSTLVTTSRARILIWARRPAEAERIYRLVLPRDTAFFPGLAGLGLAQLDQGRPRDAVATFARVRALGGARYPVAIPLLAFAQARAGDREAARATVRALEARAVESYVPSEFFVILHIGLGEHELAMAALEEAARRRSALVNTLAVEPLVDPLRTHPRFQALLRTLRLDGAERAARLSTGMPATAALRDGSAGR